MTGIDAPIGLRAGENGGAIWMCFLNAVNGLLTVVAIERVGDAWRCQPAERSPPRAERPSPRAAVDTAASLAAGALTTWNSP
jgi:hypothetical protein